MRWVSSRGLSGIRSNAAREADLISLKSTIKWEWGLINSGLLFSAFLGVQQKTEEPCKEKEIVRVRRDWDSRESLQQRLWEVSKKQIGGGSRIFNRGGGVPYRNLRLGLYFIYYIYIYSYEYECHASKERKVGGELHSLYSTNSTCICQLCAFWFLYS